MKTIDYISELVSFVSYKDWRLKVKEYYGRPVLQVHCDSPERWTGRKWFLSYHMTDTEIISTCFKAVLTAEEHECRENFRYLGRAVFGPHISIHELFAIADRVDVRTNAMEGE